MRQATVRQTDGAEAASERELVQRAQTGDSAAFRAIIQCNNRRLFRIARSILKNDTEAEDVVQETYFRAFEHLSDFRGESTMATWLARIAINEAQGRLRRQRPTVDLAVLDIGGNSMSEVIPFPINSNSDPERMAAQREVRRLMEQAIDDLPDAFRVVFVMRIVEGMSIEETASFLGLREETVKTRVHRARHLLRQALDEQLAPALKDSFPFDGARCAHIADLVLKRLDLIER